MHCARSCHSIWSPNRFGHENSEQPCMPRSGPPCTLRSHVAMRSVWGFKKNVNTRSSRIHSGTFLSTCQDDTPAVAYYGLPLSIPAYFPLSHYNPNIHQYTIVVSILLPFSQYTPSIHAHEHLWPTAAPMESAKRLTSANHPSPSLLQPSIHDFDSDLILDEFGLVREGTLLIR